MKLKVLTILGLIGLVGALGWSGVQSSQARSGIKNETLSLTGRALHRGTGTAFVVDEAGLTMAEEALTAVFTSEIIEAPFPFNAVVPEPTVHLPDGASLQIRVRTQKAGGEWSSWHILPAHSDFHEDEGDADGYEIIVVPAADVTHDLIQFEVSTSRYVGDEAPTLEQLDFVFIDATAGPSTEELIERQRQLDAAANDRTPADTEDFPRPFVISRAVWCTEPECWYSSSELDYEPVTHLLMHHTVTTSSGDPADTVRAIWNYHAFNRGWDDIGYNYLIALDGTIFEGHLNENYAEWDVVGTHAADANWGGLGVSLIGNFTSPDEGNGIEPTAAMMDSMANLFAWKADQRNIDPYGASQMVAMNWGLSHIMGHRDVYGGLNTLCPGGRAHARLPWLRDAVASRMGYVSPYIFVDETSSAFTKSNANWYEGPRGCGNNGHSYYTWSTTDPAESANWGQWTLNVPTDGRYRIEVYAPYCNTGEPETLGARYTVNHAFGDSQVTINQDAQVGEWMTVGEFNLNAGNGNSLYLTDLTTTDNGRGIWFDAVRLLYLGETIAYADNVAPANELWLTDKVVDFEWDIFSTAPVLETRLQVATNPSMTNLVFDQTWSGSVLQHTHTFSQDYANLYWRVTAVIQNSDGSTGTAVSDSTLFHLDSEAPVSSVDHILQYPHQSGYFIYWSGSDATSGIAGYTVQYRVAGETTWITWLSNTLLKGANFDPQNSQVYEFRVHATDLVGNSETPHATPDRDTSQSILLSHAIMLPIVR